MWATQLGANLCLFHLPYGLIQWQFGVGLKSIFGRLVLEFWCKFGRLLGAKMGQFEDRFWVEFLCNWEGR